MFGKAVLIASAALVAVSVSVWLLFVYPMIPNRRAEEMRSVRAAALSGYEKCVTDADKTLSERWTQACTAQSKKSARECRLDSTCVHGTFNEGTETCVPRKDFAPDVKIDHARVDANCAAAFPDDSDCLLSERGEHLNAQHSQSVAECRTEFDARMVGYADPGARR